MRRQSATGRIRLRDVGEDRLLEQLFARLPGGKGSVVKAGDDCALVKLPSKDHLLVLKTDCVVEKIHFESAAEPAAIGWKAMMRPLSDFAAVSGIPQFALVTLIVSADRAATWAKKLYSGLIRAARRFNLGIVGGETSATRGPAAISVSVAGFVEKERWVSRNGGKAGDDLFVTGRLGGSIQGKHLRFIPRINESRWLTKNFPIHAMIDLSDGLGVDLPRLARASKVGFEIEEDALPRARGANPDDALTNGEDYELLFAISPRHRRKLKKAWSKKFPNLPLTWIGRLNRQSAIGNLRSARGYIHFQQSGRN
jgi:thiamine-monophosphate kinase